MRVVKEMRCIEFPDGLGATAVIEAVRGGGTRAYYYSEAYHCQCDLPHGMTMASRKGIINFFKKKFGYDEKEEIPYEEYYCRIWIPEKNIILDFKAAPSSHKQYIDLKVMVNGVHIFKGKEKISFNSIHGMQDLALSKFNEYEKQKEMRQNNISKPVTMQKKVNIAQQKTNITQQKSGMMKKDMQKVLLRNRRRIKLLKPLPSFQRMKQRSKILSIVNLVFQMKQPQEEI